MTPPLKNPGYAPDTVRHLLVKDNQGEGRGGLLERRDYLREGGGGAVNGGFTVL